MKKDWMIKQSELDEDQLAVLNATLDKSCVVSGCAGSGKSVLALIKAKRIQEEKGDDYQVIIYTKALAGYMNSGREYLELKNRFTYHWEWQNRLNKPSADYVIVDEIQDFTKDEVLEFISATNKKFFFYGDNAQSIYDKYKEGGTMDINDIRSLISNKENKPKPFELYRNYRLPLPVARFSQHIGRDLQEFQEQVYKSQEVQIPYVLGFNNLEEELQRITGIIKEQELTDVAILVPDNNKAKIVYDELNRLNYKNIEVKFGEYNTLNFHTNKVKIMTYHSAKGLQFETVFLPEVLNDITQDQNALYVAVTRTWKNLYIMYSGAMPSYLASIPKDLYLATESNNDEFEDI